MKTIRFIELTRTITVPREGVMLLEETIGLPTSVPISQVLISAGVLQARILSLAQTIAKQHKQKEIYCVVLLHGASVFFEVLKAQLELLGKKVIPDSIIASSFKGTKSTGKVTFKKKPKALRTPQVLLIEDIIDSGLTVHEATIVLESMGAVSIKTCTLLDNPLGRKYPIRPDYCGFIIPPEFVVGFGLDYNGKYRELPFIGIFKK